MIIAKPLLLTLTPIGVAWGLVEAWRFRPVLALLMGLLAGYFAARTGIPQHVRLFLTTGVLGGFTTFSAFSLDAALLIERHAYWSAAAYVLGSVILSLVALFGR